VKQKDQRSGNHGSNIPIKRIDGGQEFRKNRKEQGLPGRGGSGLQPRKSRKVNLAQPAERGFWKEELLLDMRGVGKKNEAEVA